MAINKIVISVRLNLNMMLFLVVMVKSIIPPAAQ